MFFDEKIREGSERNEMQELREKRDDYDDIKEINVELVESVEGLEQQPMVVTGSPFEIAGSLDCTQGDNRYNVASDCGLVSCSNYLKLCGIEVSEDEIVGYALANNIATPKLIQWKLTKLLGNKAFQGLGRAAYWILGQIAVILRQPHWIFCTSF